MPTKFNEKPHRMKTVLSLNRQELRNLKKAFASFYKKVKSNYEVIRKETTPEALIIMSAYDKYENSPKMENDIIEFMSTVTKNRQ